MEWHEHYLIKYPPARSQFRSRRGPVSGVFVVHTAENAPDEVGPDDGAENVARFIRNRSTPGSYHGLGDTDSFLRLVPLSLAAFQDGTGSNDHAIAGSLATQAHRWLSTSEWRRQRMIQNLAFFFAEAANFVEAETGISVPARRISRAESERRVPGFISHAERDPGRRSDPGEHFPWGQLFHFYKLYRGSIPEEDMIMRTLVWLEPEGGGKGHLYMRDGLHLSHVDGQQQKNEQLFIGARWEGADEGSSRWPFSVWQPFVVVNGPFANVG